MQQVLDSLRRIEVTLQNIHNKLIDIDSNTKPRIVEVRMEHGSSELSNAVRKINSKEELDETISKARNAKPLPPLGNRDF